MNDELKTHKLSCYLYKQEYKEFKDVILQDKLNEDEYAPLELVDESKAESICGFLRENKDNKPPWLSKMKDLFEIPDLKNISNSMIFFVKANERIFVFTNGYSQSMVDTKNIEWDFGVKVALNILSGNEIRGVDTKKLSLSAHQKREISNGNSNIYEYEFDFDEEFINSISGKSSNELGTSLTGRESLHISTKIDINEIVSYCEKLYSVYEKNDYIKKFPFYDRLKPNNDIEIYDYFIKELKKAIKKKEYNKILLLYPNINDFNYFNYHFTFQRKYNNYDDITIENVVKFIDEKGLDVEELDIKEFKISISDGEKHKKYSLADYIVFEFEKDERRYIHTKNLILEIEKDFYNKIVNEIEFCEIESINDLYVPTIFFNKVLNEKEKYKVIVEKEGNYNIRFSDQNKDNTICLDKNNFRGFPNRSQDQVEICDVITKEKEFICIKVYKHSSAPMSHLFQQGFVSADMLYEVKEYREKINEEVKYKFGENYLNIDDIERSEITFVYGIAMEKEGKVSENLPFFSKIGLRQNIKNIKKLGYQVKILKIDFEKNEELLE